MRIFLGSRVQLSDGSKVYVQKFVSSEIMLVSDDKQGNEPWREVEIDDVKRCLDY